MAFNKKDLDEQIKQLKIQSDLQDKLNSSGDAYLQGLREQAELQKNISHISKTIKELESEKKDISAQILENRKAGIGLLGDEKKANEDARKALWKQLGIKKDGIKTTKLQLTLLEKTNKEYVTAISNVNKLNMGLKEGVGFLKKTPGLIKKGFGQLKGFGVFEMDKAIREAGVEMGKMASVGTSFGRDIAKASIETQSMGVHVKDLAKMQTSYSRELGRTVMLSQEGFEAMSQMAKGTILGADGAGQLAAEMDRFNISVTDTAAIVGDVTNMSEKMGLNAGKVIKTLQKNLKMANKYHFKGGVKGMVKMAAQAEKFHMSMETTAQFADKLFNIEGAVEMAAKLNTMGGAWAKLGDPMKLMNMARNDMEGLQTSVIDATAGMADFNKETGEFSFSGLELHRMKELEKITGISAEQMAEMAKSKAKFSKINAQLGMDVNPEMREFIENSAVFKDGEYKIKLSGSKDLIPIDQLTKNQKEQMKHDAKTLKQRAENSQTFDDQLTNMLENTKTLLLPLLEGLNDSMPAIIDGFKAIMNSDLADKIRSAALTIGKIVGGAIKFLIKFPAAIVGAMAGLGLAKAAMWYLNGKTLGMGFNSVASAGGGGGLPGSGGGKNFAGKAAKAGFVRGADGKLTKMSRMQKLGGGKFAGGKFAAGSKGAMGAGMGLGVAGMGMDLARDGMLDNKNSDVGKAMGVASSALKGAGIGMMLGPLGALAGALIGGAVGAIQEYGGPDSGRVTSIPVTKKVDDAILSGGGITPIDTKDKVFEVSKPGGAFDKAGGRGNGGAATTTSTNSKVHITFDTINIKSDEGVGKIDLNNDSAFMAMLATKIKEALSKSANGGVLSPNPS